MNTNEDTLFIGQQVELQITGEHISEHVSETVVVALDRDGQYESCRRRTARNLLTVTLTEPLATVARFRAFVVGDDDLQAATPSFLLNAPFVAWTQEPASEITVNESVPLCVACWRNVQRDGKSSELDASGESTLAQDLTGTKAGSGASPRHAVWCN